MRIVTDAPCVYILSRAFFDTLTLYIRAFLKKNCQIGEFLVSLFSKLSCNSVTQYQ